MLAEVVARLEEKGHRAAAVPVERLAELREHFEDLSEQGTLDAGVARELLSNLTFEPPGTIPHPRSLVVVATRDPAVWCTFRWRGEGIAVPVPPTYLHLRRKSEEVTQKLMGLLPEGSHAACLINAPHKLLAVRSGLSRYGRNNITYISGLGSFYRLTTVCTDVGCEGGDWLDPSMMAACEGCERCAAACPTGAMLEDRVLLRAERCITYWNEKPPEVPFPEWLAEDWHNCLVGCMRCQLACPENEAVLDYKESGPDFTEDETEALLGGGPPDELQEDLRDKLERWDLLEWLSVLPRNLSVHLPGAQGPAPG